MGFKDMNRAYTVDIPPVKGITPLAMRSVLNIVAAATDDKTHETFVSRKTIGERSGGTPTTVKRALEALERLGMISREERFRKNGSQSSSLIRFTPGGSSTDQEGSSEDQRGVRHGPLPRSSTDPRGVLSSPPIYQSEDQSNDQSSSTGFDVFWEIWPKKLNWEASREAWIEATKHASEETILRAARDYASSPSKPEFRYIPGPVKWLGRRGWMESLPTDQQQTPGHFNFNTNTFGTSQMQTVQPGSDCGPRRHLRQPDGTCRACEQRDIPENEAWEPPRPRAIEKNDEWMYR